MIASLRTSSTSSGVISGSGLASAKMIGFLAIDLTMARVTAPLTDRPRNTSAPFMASSSVRDFGVDGMGRLPLVHALLAALIDHALGVAQDGVVVRQADGLDELQAGDRRRAGAVHDHA